MTRERLLEELEQARVAYARAEVHARTQLAEEGILEQMQIDAAFALRKTSESAAQADDATTVHGPGRVGAS